MKGEKYYYYGIPLNDYVIKVWKAYKNKVNLGTVCRDWTRLNAKYKDAEVRPEKPIPKPYVRTQKEIFDYLKAYELDLNGLSDLSKRNITEYLAYLKKNNFPLTQKTLLKYVSILDFEILLKNNPAKISRF